MSLESASAVVAAPLQYETWHEIKVKADPDSWLPPYPLHNTNFYFKFVHDSVSASFCLIVTDLCFVWLTRVESKNIDAEMRKFNPSIRKKTTNHTIQMLEELLRDNNQQQFHLVKLEVPDEDESDSRGSRAAAASSRGSASSGSFTPSLRLDSSMSLGGVISFKWRFQCKSYGTPLDQCTFLRNQMYLPLHEMIRVLSYQLERERQKNQLLTSGAAPPAAAAAAAGGRGAHAHHPAAAAGGDISLSLSLPSLNSAEREAHLAALGGPAALQSFDAFSSAFHFSKAVGSLYVGVVNRLSGNEDGLGLDPAAPASLPPSSWDAPPSQRAHSPNFDMERKHLEDAEGASVGGDSKRTGRGAAAGRARGTKRDRSPSPAAAVSSSAAAAAAAAYGARDASERDPDLDYKHAEDEAPSGGYPSPSMPMPSFDGMPSAPGGASGSYQQSQGDIGGHVDDDGVYRESEAERQRREALQKQLEAQKKRKKKKTFV